MGFLSIRKVSQQPTTTSPITGGNNSYISAARYGTQFKTAGYAAIKYEKAPVVTDTVQTKDKDGNPLLAGYVTPNHVWVA